MKSIHVFMLVSALLILPSQEMYAVKKQYRNIGPVLLGVTTGAIVGYFVGYMHAKKIEKKKAEEKYKYYIDREKVDSILYTVRDIKNATEFLWKDE